MVMITISRTNIPIAGTDKISPMFSISADVKNEADIEFVTNFIGALFSRDFNPMIKLGGEEDGKDTRDK